MFNERKMGDGQPRTKYRKRDYSHLFSDASTDDDEGVNTAPPSPPPPPIPLPPAPTPGPSRISTKTGPSAGPRDVRRRTQQAQIEAALHVQQHNDVREAAVHGQQQGGEHVCPVNENDVDEGVIQTRNEFIEYI